MVLIFFIVTLFVFVIKNSFCIDYCSETCQNGYAHTLCNGCNLQSPCAEFQQSPLSSNEISVIVDEHNYYRNKVATGLQYNQPKGADINVLIWDENLAHSAQCLANDCRDEHDMCRDEFGKYPVGQNIASQGLEADNAMETIKNEQTLKTLIKMWFDENRNYDYSIEFYRQPMVGHYTQLLWANTSDVGCGRVYFMDNNFVNIRLICNYGPAGNTIGEMVYQVGLPCSKCTDDMKCSRKYPGLCGNINARDDISNSSRSAFYELVLLILNILSVLLIYFY